MIADLQEDESAGRAQFTWRIAMELATVQQSKRIGDSATGDRWREQSIRDTIGAR
jgi:hypothetical protein